MSSARRHGTLNTPSPEGERFAARQLQTIRRHAQGRDDHAFAYNRGNRCSRASVPAARGSQRVPGAGRALLAALDVPSGIYNVCRDRERVSNRRFTKAACWHPLR